MAKVNSLPDLGAWVTFSAYHEKPTSAEVEAYGQELDELTGRIGYQRRQNPNHSHPAMVIGSRAVQEFAPVLYNGGNWFAAWQDKRTDDGALIPLRRFYVVRFTLTGPCYLVDAADLQIVQQRRRAG